MMKRLLTLVLLCASVAQAQVSNSTVTVQQANPANLNATVSGTVDIGTGSVTISGSLPAGTNNIGDVDVASSALPAGASTEATLSTLNGKVANGSGTAAGAVRVELPTDGTGVVGLNAGTNNIGDVDVASSALPAGASTEATLSTLNGKVANGSGTAAGAVRVELPTDGTGVVGLNAGTNNIGSVNVANGQVAAGAAISGNPFHIGVLARNSNPTAVTSGQVVSLMADVFGKLINSPYAPLSQGARGKTGAFNSASAQTMFTAPGAGLRYNITSCIFANSNAAAAAMILLDSGSIIYADVVVPPTNSVVMTFPLPVRMGDNAAVQCAGPAQASLYCSCYGYATAN